MRSFIQKLGCKITSSKRIEVSAFIILFTISGCKQFPPETQPKEEFKEYVVLLHGLARSSKSMIPLQKALSKKGYGTCNIDYPSTDYPIEYLSENYLPDALKRCIPDDADRVHFVTHSMGGIVLRHYLKNNSMKRLGSVVMLSPPNAGTEVVDTLGNIFIFKALNGPASIQLGTGSDSVPIELGPVDFKLGILTGSKTINPILSALIPGEDDGKVSVQRAQIQGMSDFMVVPHSHPFIMRSKETIKQTIYFLEHGRFQIDPDKNDIDVFSALQ
jgi:pimeloyl-ACP methyl ester carboxylesterase